MRHRLLQLLSALVVRRPLPVLVVSLLIGIASASLIPGLHVRAGHSGVVSSDTPDQQRFMAFLKRFGSPNVLFALVKGGNPALRHALVDGLSAKLAPSTAEASPQGRNAAVLGDCAAALAGHHATCVRDVVGRLDLERLQPYAPLFIPLPKLRQLVEMLTGPTLGVGALSQVNDLAGALDLARAEVERRAKLPPPTGQAAREAETGMAQAAQGIGKLGRLLASPGPMQLDVRGALAGMAGGAASSQGGVDAQGYLRSRDGRINVALLQPYDDSDEPSVVVPFVQLVQRTADQLADNLTEQCAKPNADRAAASVAPAAGEGGAGPSACDGPLRVTLAGLPALIVAEQRVLDRDTLMTSIVAAVAILLIFALGFRSLRQSLIGMVPLAIAMACTLALVRLTVGELNLITTAFIPTVLGIGIDFSVQLLARYNEARRAGADAVSAVQTSIESAGPGVLTAALTMAGAFLALTACRFKGFADLGLISAMGLLVALAAAMITGSAMLTCQPLRWLQRPPRLLHASGEDPAIRLTRRVFTRRGRWLLLAGGMAMTVFMLWRARGIEWSYNYLHLLPADSSAVEAVTALAKDTDFSFEVAALEASSLAQARQWAERLATKSTVGRVESLVSYLPDDQPAKLAVLARLRSAFEATSAAASASNTSAPHTPATHPSTVQSAATFDLERFRTSIGRLTETFEDLQFEAKQASQTAAAKGLLQMVRALRQLDETIAGQPPQRMRERLAALQQQLLEARDGIFRLLQRATTLGELNEAKLLELLPPGVSKRLYHRGAYALYVYPKGSLWARGFLPRFVDQLRSVDPNATGFPVSHWETNLAIERGFRSAILLAGIAIVLLLWLDFRSLRYTAFALFPLIIGMAWMWGSMSLLGMPYNFANIVGFPMIVGIGVAYGVYILHRHKQERGRDIPCVVRNTGLGVLLSALANMAGFGSIALATHRGAHSLGLLLLFGCGFCLVTATLLLPALLGTLERRSS